LPPYLGVTHYTCVSSSYTMAHEMGHNMGLHRDIYLTGTDTVADRLKEAAIIRLLGRHSE